MHPGFAESAKVIIGLPLRNRYGNFVIEYGYASDLGKVYEGIDWATLTQEVRKFGY